MIKQSHRFSYPILYSLAILLLVFSSCSITKNLEEDEYLYMGTNLNVADEKNAASVESFEFNIKKKAAAKKAEPAPEKTTTPKTTPKIDKLQGASDKAKDKLFKNKNEDSAAATKVEEQEPKEKPAIVYKNNLATQDLGIRFRPVKETLNSYSG